MDLMITSKILETLETGVVLEVNADDLHVRAYIVVSAVDMAVIEKLIPLAVFESGAQVHVAGIEAAGDITEQVVQILENMEPTVLVECLSESTATMAWCRLGAR